MPLPGLDDESVAIPVSVVAVKSVLVGAGVVLLAPREVEFELAREVVASELEYGDVAVKTLEEREADELVYIPVAEVPESLELVGAVDAA